MGQPQFRFGSELTVRLPSGNWYALQSTRSSGGCRCWQLQSDHVRGQAPKANSSAADPPTQKEAAEPPAPSLDITTCFDEMSGWSAAATRRPSRSLSSSQDETTTLTRRARRRWPSSKRPEPP